MFKHTSVLKMRAKGSSETLAAIDQITRRHFPEDSNLNLLNPSVPYMGRTA
jgi:hypothetical protein